MNKHNFLVIFIVVVSLIMGQDILGIFPKGISAEGNNKPEKITMVTGDTTQWRSEGGGITGIYKGEHLICIEVTLYRSMYQTNEKYYFYDNTVFYEKITYFYEEPMDISKVSIETEYLILVDDTVYKKEYRMEDNEYIFVLCNDENRVIERLKEYIPLMENAYKTGGKEIAKLSE